MVGGRLLAIGGTRGGWIDDNSCNLGLPCTRGKKECESSLGSLP